MPSSANPNNLVTGPGKVPANSSDATSQLFNSPAQESSGGAALITNRPVVVGSHASHVDYREFTSAGDTSQNFTSTFWMGDSANNQLGDLFHVVQGTDGPLINYEPVVADDGTVITVASVAGASIGDGFFNGALTINFSGTIPAGVDYKIFYGVPQSLNNVSDLTADALIRLLNRPGLRSKQDIVTSISSGFDETYRRSTGPIDQTSINPDMAGDGATITRDGRAITGVMPWIETRAGTTPDDLQAAFRAEHEDFVYTVETQGYGGDVGFALVAADRMTADADELSGRGPARSATSSFIYRSMASVTVDGGTRTFLQAGVTTGEVNTATLTLDNPWYFQNANGTAIWNLADIIVLDLGGGDVRSYRIELTATDDECLLRSLSTGGGVISLGAGTAVTVLAWYHAYVDVGGTGGDALVIRHPRFIGDSETDNQPSRTFRMVQANRFVDYLSLDWEDEFATVSFPKFFVNGTGDCGTKTSWNGDLGLVDDGTAVTRASGLMRHSLAQRFLQHEITTDQDYRINPRGAIFDPGNGDEGEGFGAFHVRLTGGAASPITVTFLGANLSGQAGTFFEIMIENVSGMDLTLVWPSQCKFSDPSDAVPGPSYSLAGSVIKYRGTVWGASGNVWLMERLDYSL